MIYFSHRGANTLRVQNTSEAFALAHTQGARYFELDVHLLRDSSLVVHHDYSLLSTAGVDVQLKDLTAADLKKYPLNNQFTHQAVYVPLLEDVLPLITPGLMLLNIELKNDGNCYPGLEETLLKNLPTSLLPKVLFSSFDYSALQRLRALAPKVRIGQLTRSFNVQQALDIQAESVHTNYTRFTPQMAQICHENGLKVYCYTVNDKELATRLATQGADGIFTDKITDFLA
ncbi:MAG: hypothetical protein J6Y17_02350 [Elusimicrobiaceae bacterium]|nr:hypothetical protein [Elusimicrobiaceae bacterium]